ncbi:MAG: amidohydrolase family protein, partial [Candidatus Bathyarchaeia archaeon]
YSLKLEAKTWENRSYVDYGFHGGLRPMTSDEEIERLWSDGVFGLKTFLASPDLHWPSVSDGDLLRILRKTAEIDALLVIHAENESMLSVNMKRLKDLGRKDYASHLEWRPPVAEVEAVRRSVFLLSQAGSRGLIAHASVAESIIEVRDAKNRGNRIYVETCPQYLFLSDEDLKARGPWLKCAPPLRSREESSELWRLLNSGWIDVLASDHAPHPRELKEEGLSDMWKAPNGLPGIETSLPLMLTAVKNGNLSLSILVKTFSENPAKLYGIYPRKGTIAVGSDADLVLVDFDKSERISSDRLEMKCGWSPYEGFELKGLPVMTVVRGEVVMEDREVVGVEGHGIHIRRNFHVPKK